MKLFLRFLKQVFQKLASFNSDFLFYLAATTMPFENLVFAPSSGWATITPLIFFLYAFLNLYYLKPYLSKIRPILLFFAGFSILGSLTTLFFHGRLDDYFSAYVPIILGLACLSSFLEFYAKHQKADLKAKLQKLVSVIIIAYLISLLIGLLEYFAVKYHLTPVTDIFNLIFKRNYLAKNRVQFFFTEPSFIGMHLFGVLLPLFWLTRRKDLLFLIILYAYSALLFGAGVRIILDILIILIILAILYLPKTKEKLFLPLTFVAFLIFLTSVSAINGRFHKIFFGFLNTSPETTVDCALEENQDTEECRSLARQSGVNSDGSFASRVFRIKASLFGYTKSPLGFLTGFGLGNSIYPVRLGHAQAKKDYKSTYLKEINDLESPNYHDDSVSYCLYTRIISEFGIFALLLFVFYLILLAKNSKLFFRYHYLFIILYLYLQFESLSFYAIWLFIATMLVKQKQGSND